MRVALMIEGQEDVTWEDWVALAETCEAAGVEALFRSDHYLSVQGRQERGSLDAWSTLNALAARTETIRLGTMVSPASFRHPSVLAKSVVTADHVSGGRVELGIGAGWLESEHRAYGFPFHDTRARMDVLEEQLQIIRGQWGDGPFSFEGEHYRIEDLDALPKPVQQPHPPLVMGGKAGPRGAALAARFASEYNVVSASPEEAAQARGRLADACREAGRDPADLGFSLMHGFVVGADDGEVRARADRLAELRGGRPVDLDSWLAGTPDQIAARLREYADAGVQRVMFQHLLHRDTDALELLAGEVMPALAG
jgi:F420-dependent oxidoreductase-like protein